MSEPDSGLEKRMEDIRTLASESVQVPSSSSSKLPQSEPRQGTEPPQGDVQYAGSSTPGPRSEGNRGVAQRTNSFLTPSSSPAPRTLLTPASTRASHLPTPQSPNNLSLNFGLADHSPVRNIRPASSQRQREHPIDEELPPNGSFPTPESSPLFSRRPRSAHTPTSPSPPRTPRPSSSRHVFQAGIFPMLPNTGPSTPPHPRDISPPARSTLSSPFVDRSAQRTPTHTSHPRTPPIHSPHPSSPETSPMVLDAMFSPVPSNSTTKSTPSLKAPVPTRPSEGEMNRIRLQLAADQAAQHDHAESRRPEYLKRTKRPLSDLDLDLDYNMDNMDTGPGGSAGVTDSPTKGRRIALFQETSEESFEQSLLAGGYARYGDLPAYTDPQLSQQSNGKGKAAMSQRAMDWLNHPTPAPARPSQSTNGTRQKMDDDWAPSEREIKKRRRLAAFEDPHPLPNHGKLVAVEIEGRGRVLVDKLMEEQPASPTDSPSGKKRGAGGRKKKARSLLVVSPTKRGKAPLGEENLTEGENVPKPNWPDAEFPWSVRNRERNEWSQREHDEKMKWIERFLDRDSDEESDEEDQSLGLTARYDDDESPPPSTQRPRAGRGKMVPIKANPNAHPHDPPERVMVPTDPADARAALLSRRSVRAMAFRRRQQALNSDGEPEIGEDEEVCVCRGRDDGRELVQCDECHTWYHLECIGIRTIEELGREEDPWYCHACLAEELPSGEPSSEPTFVPTDDEPLRRKQRDPLMSSSSAMSPSVGTPWAYGARVPRTPVRSGRDVRQLYSSSSWDPSSSSRYGPTTPSSGAARHSRTYQTPVVYDASDEMAFSMNTPQRPARLAGPFTTPKMSTSTIWGNRSTGPFQTPSRHVRDARRSSAMLPFALEDSAGRTPLKAAMPFPYDDTPIRRSHPRAEQPLSLSASTRGPRHVLDSPLGPKSRLPMHPLGVPDSPTLARPSARKPKAKVAPGSP